MNKKSLIKKLSKYGAMNTWQQRMYKKEIIDLFRKFWHLNPSEDEFAEAMAGVVIFSNIACIMSKENLND